LTHFAYISTVQCAEKGVTGGVG